MRLNNKSYLSRLTRSSSWHSSVKAGRRWYELFLGMIHILVGKVSKSYFSAVLHFVRHCIVIRRKQGIPGLCKRLKAYNVLLMQALAGTPHKSSQELGVAVSRTGAGYPRSIPVHHRRRLAKGDEVIVRLYLSFYSLYRVLDWKGKLNLSTITKGPIIRYDPKLFEEFKTFLPIFFSNAKLYGFDFGSYAKDDMKKFKSEFRLNYLPITKSGPGSSGGATSMWAIPYQINAWFHPDNARLYSALEGWCILMDIKHVYVFMNMFKRVYDVYLHVMKIALPWQRCLGKLSIKEEPGKVRVFAMVDYITQVILHPLHRLLFKFLSSIPQDGTFDQEKPVRRLIQKLETLWDKVNPPLPKKVVPKHQVREVRTVNAIKVGTTHIVLGASVKRYEELVVDKEENEKVEPIKRKFDGFDLAARKAQFGKIWADAKIGRTYSFDLSAATDRLPINYQAVIVQQLHPKLGVTWKEILIGRDYYTSRSMKDLDPNLPEMVRYTVGQPMGALSSWAMLAVTHHAIVQWAAHRVGSTGWFEYYAVLGDDVVIGNDKVAEEYLRIMRALGVEISLAKTLTGKDRSMEFAKRFFLRGRDVSPLSTLEYLAGRENISALVTLVAKARRLCEIRLADVVKAVGFGYRVCGSLDGTLDKLGSRARGLVLQFMRPGQPDGVTTMLDWLLLDTVKTAKVVTEEIKGRMVESLEAVIFKSFEDQVESMRKKILSPPRSKVRGKVVDDPNRVNSGSLLGSPSTLDHPSLERCRELLDNHVTLHILTDVLEALDNVCEDVRSQIAYYKTRVKVIPKTPSEKLDMIFEIMDKLEERIASVPAIHSLWTKPQEKVTTQSRSLRLWARIRAIIRRSVSTGEVRTDSRDTNK